MILAEKILKHRKENGWSQEDLAYKLNVSRQSISKWESGTSIPDIERIILMSEVFGVSTDYLLKDEVGIVAKDEEYTLTSRDENLRRVTLEEANAFMEFNEKHAKAIAMGIVLCILSPALLILLNHLSEEKIIDIGVNIAQTIGLVALFLMITTAVTIFIRFSMKMKQYEYFEDEDFELEYGIAGIAEAKKEKFRPYHEKATITSVALYILCALPLIISGALGLSSTVQILCVVLLLIMVAMGTFMLVSAIGINSGYDKILEEGDYTEEKKFENRKNEALSELYWIIATLIYLAWSFYTSNWGFTWIVWPIAGVLYVVIIKIAAILRGGNEI
ncbi:putative helix-turn-helix protein [Peptoniphilus sp. ING2-D1G]|nr:putative helix-turn-helix protein [Peptoniphilus sp. ING2-D1G]